MNIAILSRGEALYSTKSLLSAGEARNHTMEVLDPSYCNLAVENGKAVLYFQNEKMDDIQAIIPRIGASNTYFGTNVVRHFEAMGVFRPALFFVFFKLKCTERVIPVPGPF